MKAQTLSALAGAASTLIAAGSCPAGFTGITILSKPNELGIFTCNVYAEFDDPGDHLLAVAGTASAPLTVEMVGGAFYQHFAGDDTPPHEVLVDAFPDLAYDTFVTIGLKEHAGNDNMILTPVWPGFGAGVLQGSDLAWFVTPDSPQGAPDDNGRVLIGQFSTEDGIAPKGRFLILAVSDGEPVLRYTGFCHFLSPRPCLDGDLNFDNIVNVSDFLILLAEWGPCPPGETCFADLNSDGVVGIIDFLLLLENWTMEGPEPFPDGVVADLDGDGVVGVVDLLTLLACWGPVGAGCYDADLDSDGDVGTRDVLIMLANWGATP